MSTTLVPEASATAGAAARESRYGLENHGIRNPGTVFWNLNPVELVEHAVRRGEGSLVEGGPFNAVTALKGPPSTRVPSPRRTACSTSSTGLRFQNTVPGLRIPWFSNP